MDLQETTNGGVDKVSRYGWTMKDAPGALKVINKTDLNVNHEYQRNLVAQKVKELSANWSWVGCGCLTVALRDNAYWVIDGQHRLFAALRRSDIKALPCLVFETESEQDEAKGFLDANTSRKPVSATEKHKAMVVSGDEVSVFVERQFAALGITLAMGGKQAGGRIKCVAWCYRRAKEDQAAFKKILSLVAEISEKDDVRISERVLEGLWIINQRCEGGLDDARLVRRVREKGARVLLEAANRAAAYYASGGGAVWAKGMLSELNKGLHRKFKMQGVDE